MANSLGRPFWKCAWRFVRWPLAILILLYVALVIYRIPAVGAKERSDKMVAEIHAQRLTIDDVNGEHLPPPPDQKENDATLEGIDANANGIRDDVELEIFERYPTNAKLRAAMLQYAMSLQMEYTKTFDTATLIAVVQEEARGSGCIFDLSTGQSLKDRNQSSMRLENEVETLMLNTEDRKEYRNEVRERHMASYGLLNTEACDIDFSS